MVIFSTVMIKFCLLVAIVSAAGVSKTAPDTLQKKVENLNGLLNDNKLKAEDDPLLAQKISDLNDAMMDMRRKIEAAKEEKARKAASKKQEEEDEQKAKVQAEQLKQAEVDKQRKIEEAAKEEKLRKEKEQKAKVQAEQLKQAAELDKQRKIEEAAKEEKARKEKEQKAKVQAEQQKQAAELDKQRKMEEAAQEEKARKAALKTKVEKEQKAKEKEQQQAEGKIMPVETKSTPSTKVQNEEPTVPKKSNDEQEQYRRDIELLVKLMVPVTAWDIWVYTNVFPYLPTIFRSPSSSGINAVLMLVLLCICLWFVWESRRHSLSLENEIKAMEFKQVTQSATSPDKSLQEQLKTSKTLIQNMKQERLAADVKILALTSEKDSLTGLCAHRTTFDLCDRPYLTPNLFYHNLFYPYPEQLRTTLLATPAPELHMSVENVFPSATTTEESVTVNTTAADEKQMLLDELHKTAEQIEHLNLSLTGSILPIEGFHCFEMMLARINLQHLSYDLTLIFSSPFSFTFLFR